jgi:hypothetical protein
MLKMLLYYCITTIMFLTQLEGSQIAVLPDQKPHDEIVLSTQPKEEIMACEEDLLKSIIIGCYWQHHIPCLTLSPDKHFAVTNSQLIDLRVFPSVASIALDIHQEPINKALFSHDSTLLITVSADAVALWDITQFPHCKRHHLTKKRAVSLVEFAQNNTLLIGYEDGRCSLYRYDTKTELVAEEPLACAQNSEPTVATFSFQNTFVAIGFSHGALTLFDLSKKTAQAIPLTGNHHKSRIVSIEFDYDGDYILTAEIGAHTPLQLLVLAHRKPPGNDIEALCLRSGPPENHDLALSTDGGICIKEARQTEAKHARRNRDQDTAQVREVKLAQTRHATGVQQVFSSEDGRWMVTLAEEVTLAEGEQFIPPCLLWDLPQEKRDLNEPLQPIPFFYDISSGRRTGQQSLAHIQRYLPITLYDMCLLSPDSSLSINDFSGGILATHCDRSQLWKQVSIEDLIRFITLVRKSSQGANILKDELCFALLNPMQGPLRALTVAYLQMRSLLKISSDRGALKHSQ